VRQDILALVQAALNAVEPSSLVDSALSDHPPLDGPLRLLAVGKAASLMAAGAMRRVGARVRTGLVIAAADAEAAPPLDVVRGDHPVPSARSERAGRRALALAGTADDAVQLLVLLSGGASALMAVPADGLSLDDKRACTELLLRNGADIHALNTVRKHLSAIKGGWLAAAANVGVKTLAISDVVGDDPSVIGSGPTMPDASTFGDALGAIDACGGRGAYPLQVVERLERGARGQLPETPRASQLSPPEWRLVGSRFLAMRGAATCARQLGYDVIVRDEPVTGEARIAGETFAGSLPVSLDKTRPLCVISSGETIVKVIGRGRGGRNQEFALSAAQRLAASPGPVVLASVGTDGVDGPTDAAGAVVDQDTVARAAAAGLPPASAFLADNDSYRFFAPLNDLIKTGPTGTNVGDLQICLLG
jgi:glycerate 2-kinase